MIGVIKLIGDIYCVGAMYKSQGRSVSALGGDISQLAAVRPDKVPKGKTGTERPYMYKRADYGQPGGF